MLQDALRKTARRLDTLEEGRATEAPGIWQDFTAGLWQGGVVPSTIIFARYELQGKTVRVQAMVSSTGAGVAANTIGLTGLPFAPLYHDAPFGILELTDAAPGAWYSGPARTKLVFGPTTAWAIMNGSNSTIGINPAITLAAGDIVALFGTYEIP